MAKTQQKITLGRTHWAFEEAMKNANCPLFEHIARWVIQDDGYLSMATLVARIRELEDLESAQGIIAPDLVERQRPQSLSLI